MRALFPLAFVAMLVAGCLDSGSDPASETDAEPSLVIDKARPRESYGDVKTGPAVPPDLNATTEAAPKLIVGEWWRVRFSAYLGEDDVEVVRVVADASEEGYVMGMPHEGWLKEAIAFHAPAFGDVAPDLSYDTHNLVFQPVRFPLVAGDSWETTFATQPLIATVESADQYTATIVMEPKPGEPDPLAPLYGLAGLAGGGTTTLTYDARMHEIVRMESDIGYWEVTEHGYDYQGWVTVPRGEHTAIDYGVFGGPASDTHDPLPREVEVSGGFNRLTMMHLIVGITPGSYKIRDVTPNGTELVTEHMDDGMIIRFYEATDPDGTWTVEDTLVGVGATYSMGIAYHQYDIKLPDGIRRADHSHPVIR